jgi:hypothetical protein
MPVVAFSPDSKLLADVGPDSMAQLWAVASLERADHVLAVGVRRPEVAVACGCWHLFSRFCHHRHLRYRTQGMEIRARQMGNSGRRRRLGAASAVCG